jgi:8-oxo-dGTP pyrophosphatase MutT (NUDIX family)
MSVVPSNPAVVNQAGGVPIRLGTNGVSVLLVRARKAPYPWILPKGHIEHGESPDETALRETREEAGVDGELLGPVGAPLEFRSGAVAVRVQYFLIRVHSESPSPEGRETRWFSLDEAIGAVMFEDAQQLLRDVERVLERG